MSIRTPSGSLSAPTIFTLKKGTRVHRVYQSSFAADSFNPCAGQATRFAPVHNATGVCVPSLYAGSTIPAAIHETIFHDIAATALTKTIPQKNILIRSHAELDVTRSIKLAYLKNPALGRWKITRKELIESGVKLYSQTGQWAAAIHHQFSHVDGLVWTSHQCDPDQAFLFFGDRVRPSDFSIVTSRDGATDKSFLRDVRNEGRQRGVTITV
jgi:hypothetical protein